MSKIYSIFLIKIDHSVAEESIAILIFHWANLFARSEKQILAMWLVNEKLDQFLLFYCSREQIHLVENGLKVEHFAVCQDYTFTSLHVVQQLD
jgi:hypothetical protein